MSADDCPKDCNHDTFDYCADSGTHCGKHCVCPCLMCIKDREREVAKESAQ